MITVVIFKMKMQMAKVPVTALVNKDAICVHFADNRLHGKF